MLKGKFNTHSIFLWLLCGLGSSVQMMVAMQPSINMMGSTETSEIIASKECKASEVSVADQKKVLGHESISQESTKLPSGSPFENYLRTGCHKRVQHNSALTQPASFLQDAQPTSSSVNSSGLPYASNVFPRIIPPATLMATIATPRPEGLSLSGQNCEGKDSSSHHYKYLGDDVQLQACHRRVKSAPDYFPQYSPRGNSKIDADDCCDDICYECCCVKDGCICCGTSLMIGFLLWLKSNTGSVQE